MKSCIFGVRHTDDPALLFPHVRRTVSQSKGIKEAFLHSFEVTATATLCRNKRSTTQLHTCTRFLAQEHGKF